MGKEEKKGKVRKGKVKKIDSEKKSDIKITIISCIIGILLMYIHYKFYISELLFFGSITLFRTGILIGICSYIFGIVINQYKEKHT